MDFAAVIKERVSTPEVFAFYGFLPNSAGFVRCPFHEEKTASMKVYGGSKGYHCFGGCGAHGDVVDFVKNYFGLSFAEAQRKINEDFALGLPIGDLADREALKKMAREAEARRKQREAVTAEAERLQKEYDRAFAEWTRLDLQAREFAPSKVGGILHPLYGC